MRKNLYASRNYLGNDLFSTSPSCNGCRSKSSESTIRSCFLDVPSKNVVHSTNRIGRKRSPTGRDHADINKKETRSRSSSPFDWIEREVLPRGSPTFEKVMCEMLSDTEISPKSSDTETSWSKQERVKQKTCKSYTSKISVSRRKVRSKAKV